jgi:hypothetical protein
MKLKFIKDTFGKELLTDENEVHQVMMEWEKPYMEKSIEILNPFGSVLEIGFGMGYSASKICKYDEVSEYTVIECSPTVWKKFEEWKKTQRDNLKINLIKGRWQDMLETLGIFDCIYFDDYNGDNATESFIRYYKFLYRILTSHVKIGTKISSYSTNCNNKHNNIKCINVEYTEYDIDIPEYCKYARGSKMYIPIYTVISEVDDDLKIKIFGDENKINEINEKIKIANNYYSKPKSIYCNLLIIDNFYNNPMETRNYILTQEFTVKGNYPGQRTISYANSHLKEMIQGYIKHFAGNITEWSEGGNSYNGSFQYTTSRNRTWIHTDHYNNWAGVLYMTPNAPVTSGTGIYRFKDGTRFEEEKKIRDNTKLIDDLSQDYTKWEIVDVVGNIFNRLVLFNSKQFHASLDYFGTNKENGRLFQVFFFSTEK